MSHFRAISSWYHNAWLGLPHTQRLAFVGWIFSINGRGDGSRSNAMARCIANRAFHRADEWHTHTHTHTHGRNYATCASVWVCLVYYPTRCRLIWWHSFVWSCWVWMRSDRVENRVVYFFLLNEWAIEDVSSEASRFAELCFSSCAIHCCRKGDGIEQCDADEEMSIARVRHWCWKSQHECLSFFFLLDFCLILAQMSAICEFSNVLSVV